MGMVGWLVMGGDSNLDAVRLLDDNVKMNLDDVKIRVGSGT